MKYHTNHTFDLDDYGIVYEWLGEDCCEECKLYFESESLVPRHKVTITLGMDDLKGLLMAIMWALDDSPEFLTKILDDNIRDILTAKLTDYTKETKNENRSRRERD